MPSATRVRRSSHKLQRARAASSLPAFPVVRSMRRTVRFHLGSIAFGSLVLAVVQFVRLVLDYLDKKTRRIQQESKVRTSHPTP